jgi:hypothetical protein
LTAAEGRRFAFTVGAAFLVLAGIALWRDHPLLVRVFAVLGGLLGLAGVVVPGRLGGVHRAWMGLAHLISKVTTPVFMGLVYSVAILPIGLVMQALGRNPIRHRPVNGSYWMPRGDQPRGQLKDQF